MWLKSRLFIRPIHEFMGHLHMVSMTQNSFFMSHYAPCMSQALHDHTWAQQSLGHTAKQIYDKHKAIW
jgi:DNA-binding FadR family transcriptional regulator